MTSAFMLLKYFINWHALTLTMRLWKLFYYMDQKTHHHHHPPKKNHNIEGDQSFVTPKCTFWDIDFKLIMKKQRH